LSYFIHLCSRGNNAVEYAHTRLLCASSVHTTARMRFVLDSLPLEERKSAKYITCATLMPDQCLCSQLLLYAQKIASATAPMRDTGGPPEGLARPVPLHLHRCHSCLNMRLAHCLRNKFKDLQRSGLRIVRSAQAYAAIAFHCSRQVAPMMASRPASNNTNL
jgi:hypothetical protein